MLIIVFLCTQIYSAQIYARETEQNSVSLGSIFTPNQDLEKLRGKLKYPWSEDKISEVNLQKNISQQKSISDKLARIKFEMINGNLDKAKVILLDSQFDQNFSMPIQYRYLAMIHFIEGNYVRSLELLQKKEMYQKGNQEHICLLRTLNLLILDRHFEALNDWRVCQEITSSSSLHTWMRMLITLKTSTDQLSFQKALADINIENERDDFLRIYLKLALYLNQPEKIFSRIPYLGEAVYQDNSIRELLGLLFYRNGDIKTAYQFIEDLESPNSENIKGNLYLAQKKYELAYAQFKLALQKKKNSQNALERIIPVAWVLKQWNDGLNFIKPLEVSTKDQLKKLAITAAFQTQSKDYSNARKNLEKVVIESKNSQSGEINQLLTYVSLMQKDLTTSQHYNNLTCKNLNGLNCWLQYHIYLWDDLSLTLFREDQIHPEQKLLDKYRDSVNAAPIEEEIYIGQQDIEELDSALLQKFR